MRILLKLGMCLMIGLISLMITIPAMAIPTMPSSVYGTVQVNGTNVPDGTLVEGMINGNVYAKCYTQTYQGESVYALDIPGDNTETVDQDGGLDGETIYFKIGGILSDQKSIWKSATNIRVNLILKTGSILAAAQATPSPLPTQTLIIRKTNAVEPIEQTEEIVQVVDEPTLASKEITLTSSETSLPVVEGQTIQKTEVYAIRTATLPGVKQPITPMENPPSQTAGGASAAKPWLAVIGVIVIAAAGSFLYAANKRRSNEHKPKDTK